MATKKVAKEAETENKAPKTAKKASAKKSTKTAAVEETEEITTEKKTKKVSGKKAAAAEVVNTSEPQEEIQSKQPIVIETHTEESVNEGEDLTIAQKLLSLYNLQLIMSQIDRIRVIRGELPDEIRDLEDAREGLCTRINKYQEEVNNLNDKINEENAKMQDAIVAIKRYEEQQNNVRNNREYESLSKEIEYQKLEIQVSEKHKVKHQAEIVTKNEEIEVFKTKMQEYEDILVQKKSELDDIIADTEKEEAELTAKANILKEKVDERLLTAFERIRKNARNGLGIVQIERDACGGCFSTIPPQRQLDIRLHKKIIVCEACGRIFIDRQLVESQNAPAETKEK